MRNTNTATTYGDGKSKATGNVLCITLNNEEQTPSDANFKSLVTAISPGKQGCAVTKIGANLAIPTVFHFTDMPLQICNKQFSFIVVYGHCYNKGYSMEDVRIFHEKISPCAAKKADVHLVSCWAGSYTNAFDKTDTDTFMTNFKKFKADGSNKVTYSITGPLDKTSWSKYPIQLYKKEVNTVLIEDKINEGHIAVDPGEYLNIGDSSPLVATPILIDNHA